MKIIFDYYFYEEGFPKNADGTDRDVYWYYYDKSELVPKIIAEINKLNIICDKEFCKKKDALGFAKPIFDELLANFAALNFYKIDYTGKCGCDYQDFDFAAYTKIGRDEGNGVFCYVEK